MKFKLLFLCLKCKFTIMNWWLRLVCFLVFGRTTLEEGE